MSGQPYLQFLVDVGTGRVLGNTTKFAPTPALDPAEQFFTVTCDSAGKVVVRRLHQKYDAIVIATALWSSGQLYQHAQSDPSFFWPAIEAALRQELEVAYQVPEADRTAIDPGSLGSITPTRYARPDPVKDAKTKVVAALWYIPAIIIVAIVVLGVYLYEKHWKSRFDRNDGANGEVCDRDTECASRWCKGRRCRVKGVMTNGSICEYDEDCASKNCASGRGSTYVCK